MKKILLLFVLVSMHCKAQDYQVLERGSWVYDVEVIVFGRQLAQPDSTNINSHLSNLDVPTKPLITDLQDLPLIKMIDDSQPEDDSDQWQVPLEGNEPQKQALIWVLLNQSMDNPVVRKLQTNPTIKPLHYQKWRQPATPFLSPEYVVVSSLNSPGHVDEIDILEESDSKIEPEASIQEQRFSDYAFDGVVSFAKQRYDHVAVKMNYYRIDPFGENVSYAIDQKQRIQLGEWQYFDHQQFGVMVKVIAIKEEKQNENS